MFDNIKGMALNTLRGVTVTCKFVGKIADNLYIDIKKIIDEE